MIYSDEIVASDEGSGNFWTAIANYFGHSCGGAKSNHDYSKNIKKQRRLK